MAGKMTLHQGIIVEEHEYSLADLCRACAVDAEWLLGLVEEGIVEPLPTPGTQWRFSGMSLHRVRRVKRLQHDLGVNLAGAALALQLLDDIEVLQRRLSVLESLDDRF